VARLWKGCRQTIQNRRSGLTDWRSPWEIH